LAAFLTVAGLFVFWGLWIGAILFVLIGLTGSTSGGGEFSVTWTRSAVSPPAVFAAPITSAVLSPADQLRSLRALLDDGVISQADYDAKKAEVLARM
jgi:Short C-terminal domain